MNSIQMKSIAYIPLYHSYFKYIGLMASLAGSGLFLFRDPAYQFLIYAGNLIIIYSRERKESLFTGQVRAEVFKSVFGFTLSMDTALCLTELWSEGFTIHWTPFLVIGLPTCLYLSAFYLTLLLRIRVNSSQDLHRNLVSHRRIYLVWTLVILGISGVLVFRLLNP